ncbi:transglutaminase domain-containing protein [Actinophytocola xinjiangensis]|uniref:transglutaminase domain-containing protein n=1 Tax=Actinophytocola xinjiangensis TaxID=485602 RepID=UPI000B2DE11A|nr:transglutaminase domain-containing protein [Actinophytocola xinjiangensis]
MNRVAVVGLLAATAVAGFLFAPVFGVAALVVPVLAVVVGGYLCVEVTARWARLAPVRPLLVGLVGLVAVVETVLFPTTLGGLPTGETLRMLWYGVTDSWLVTLQSTWPARPDPEQLLFVPLAVVLATVVGIELLPGARGGGARPLLALLPSLVLAGISQAYQAFDGMAAVLAAAAFGAPAAVLVWACTRGVGARRTDAWPVLLTVVATALGTVAVAGIDPLDRGAYSLKDGQLAPLNETRTTSPLQQIADRLSTPDTEVFRYRADQPVALWRLAVLDGFDGAGWSADVRPSRLGSEIDGPAGATTASARVVLGDLPGPWLPSQAIPLDVDGLAPLVDENTGVLLRGESAPAGEYQLTWAEPSVDAATLGAAPVDTRVHGGLGTLGVVPDEIDELARKSVAELRPTFQSALQLDRFLRNNYLLAEGDDLPTGHGWQQLRRFLVDTKRGTSEQWAAAYVVLARMNGIPARLAVGFRGGTPAGDGEHVVRNGDVLAWPEVAVRGVGWIPLDPTRSAESAGAAAPSKGLAAAVDQAREQLPPERDLRQPELPESERTAAAAEPSTSAGVNWLLVSALVVAALLIIWLAGVPLAVAVRARRRRNRTGAAGVLGAWSEVCDRLRGHGVAYRIGMTPRDLATVTTGVAGDRTGLAIRELGRVVDMVLWSGVDVADGHARQAWRHVAEIRRGMKTRPRPTRLRAAVDPRVLFPPRSRHNTRLPRTEAGSVG